MPDKFLCGCMKGAKSSYTISLNYKGELSSKRFDEEGFEVCPQHGYRLYGWASSNWPFLPTSRKGALANLNWQPRF